MSSTSGLWHTQYTDTLVVNLKVVSRSVGDSVGKQAVFQALTQVTSLQVRWHTTGSSCRKYIERIGNTEDIFCRSTSTILILSSERGQNARPAIVLIVEEGNLLYIVSYTCTTSLPHPRLIDTSTQWLLRIWAKGPPLVCSRVQSADVWKLLCQQFLRCWDNVIIEPSIVGFPTDTVPVRLV